MEERIEAIAYKIKGWIQSNRMGDLSNEPCLWSIYELSSISSKPVKNAATNCDNFSIEGIEESAKHLMECMSFSTHVKYFAIRLRKKQGDTGVMNNFENPYYQAPYNYKSSSIGKLPQTNGTDNAMMQMMVGMINGMHEARRADREERNEVLTELRLQNKEFEHKLDKYKSKQEIARLKEERDAAQSNDSSFIKDMIAQLMPEIKGIVRSLGDGTPYKDDEDPNNEEEEGEPVNDPNNQQVLNKSLNMLSQKVNNPETLVYKIAVVLTNASPEEADQLLGAMQGRYEQIKKNKADEQQ